MNFNRMLSVLVLFMIALFVPSVTSAANHYIRQGATGANNGSDWTNAWTDTPTTWTRGDTYWFADGTYSGRNLSTAESGTSVIMIKKATIATHGTDTGWSDTYGDGQANMGDLTITTDYWTIDGTSRTTPKSGHGFKFSTGSNTGGVYLPWAYSTSHVTVKYIEVQGDCTTCADYNGSCMYGIHARSGGTDNYFGYNYIHHTRGGFLAVAGTTNTVIEYNYMYLNGSDGGCHGDPISLTSDDYLTIRYNVIKDVEGSGIIVAHSLDDMTGVVNDYNYIYGNVLYVTSGDPTGRGDVDLGAFACINLVSCQNLYFYNNTLVNLNDGSFPSSVHIRNENYGGRGCNQTYHESIFVYNNLWYNSALAGATWDYTAPCSAPNYSNVNEDYNYYMGGTKNSRFTGSSDESFGSLDPSIFESLSASSEDFHLTGATNVGTTLGSPYNTDMDGLARGGDGIWDKGAFEFNSGSYNAKPAPPTNLVIVGQQ